MKKILKLLYKSLPFKKQIFLVLRNIKLPSSIYKHLYFNGIFNVKINKHKFKIMHYGYQIENELFWAGLTNGWEKVSMQLWIKLCENSNTIIDVGANTGVYSLVAKSINSNAQVFAFEPVKRVYEKLKINNDINSYDIQSHETALSNYNGKAKIYENPQEHVYSVTVNKNLNNDNNAIIETEISVIKLSTFIKENSISNIDLIKIDVETHEPEVLEGMEDYLKQFQPTLLIEVLNDEVGEKIQKLISNIDYLYFNIDEISKPKLVPNITKSNYFNYLICKKEIAQKLNLI